MDSTIIINIGLFIIIQATFWHILDIKRSQRESTQTLESIRDTLEELVKYTEHSNEKEINTIHAINEMCNALNKSFITTGEFMNHTSYTLKNIAVCMIPFINEIKERALRNEDYEKAQECINIINNLKVVINQTNNN